MSSRPSLLIGIHAVDAALSRAPEQLSVLFIGEDSRNPRVRALEQRARQLGVRIVSEARSALDRRSDGERHQDVLAEFTPDNIHGEKELDRLLDAISGDPVILVLDGVQDPHNLGACLRTADAAGVSLVIYPKDGTAGLTPVARRSAAGAAEILPVIEVTNLARVLRTLKEQGIWLAGTSDQATDSLYATDLGGPLALVMGGEGSGLRRLTSELCDYLVSIPMAGLVESLNVSVATGVCLYEINRQRRI